MLWGQRSWAQKMQNKGGETDGKLGDFKDEFYFARKIKAVEAEVVEHSPGTCKALDVIPSEVQRRPKGDTLNNEVGDTAQW